MDLDQPPDRVTQRREWRLSRIGWTTMGVFVLAGLLGLLGPGPFSTREVAGADGLVVVEHQRVTHVEADDTLVLRLSGDATRGPQTTVELTGSWPAGVDLQSVHPQPAEERLLPDGVAYELAVERPGDTVVTLTFRAERPGRLDGTVVVGGDRVRFRQLVMP